jgi:flagellar hook capping protein FlgD/NHL repeat-containing protein
VIRLSFSIPCLLAFALVAPAAASVAPVHPAGCLPIRIDTQPQDATVGVGGSLSLSVEASGPLPLSYLWYFVDPATGSDLALDEYPNDFDGAATPTLTFVDPVTCQTGRYYCLVTDGCDAQYSSQALVRVQPSPPAPPMVAQWGGQGSGPGQFLLAYDIAVDADDDVYVLDAGTQRVEKFHPNGTYLLQWALGPVGSLGGINYSTGVAVNSQHEVFVVDYPMHRVRVYNSAGGFLRLFGSLGSGNGQFNRPYRVAVDGADNVYVTDTFNGRVQKFSRMGTYLAQWPDAGLKGIAVDRQGHVYTCGDAVRMYGSGGTVMRSWPAGGGCHDGQLGSHPIALAVNSCNSLFVADRGNSRIQQYDVTGAFVRNWSQVGASGDEFLVVDGIAVGATGKVFTVDDGLERVRVFDAGLSLGCVVGVDDQRPAAPPRTVLEVSPNPFRGAATIRVELRDAAAARVAVLDISGRIVRVLHDGPVARGARQFDWDGREGSGARAAPGAYFVQLVAGNQRLTRALIRLE